MDFFELNISKIDAELRRDDKNLCNFLLIDNFEIGNSNITKIYFILLSRNSRQIAFESILAALHHLSIRKYHFPGFCPLEILKKMKHLVITKRLFLVKLYKQCTDEEISEFMEILFKEKVLDPCCSLYLENVSNVNIFEDTFKEAVAQLAEKRNITLLKVYLDECYQQLTDGGKQFSSSNNQQITKVFRSLDIDDHYNIIDDRENLCLIYNDYSRMGSNYDVDRLCETFSKIIGFTIQKIPITTKNKLLSSLSHFAKINSAKSDMIVCCILTHGEHGIFYSQEDEMISEEEVKDIFSYSNAPTLGGKPKIFFFQVCRGAENNKCMYLGDKESKLPNIQYDVKQPSKVIKKGDYFICHSTLPHCKSVRFKDSGSWFIQSLCNNIDKYSNREPLDRICARINTKLADLPNDDSQICEVTHAVTKLNIYLQKPI